MHKCKNVIKQRDEDILKIFDLREIVTIRRIFQHGIYKYLIYYDIDAAYVEIVNDLLMLPSERRKNYYCKNVLDPE